MIIVSQKKYNIINFDNINLIGIDGESKIKAKLGIGDEALLGIYETEARAKEVLQEIARVYADLDGYVDNADGRAIYEMPKE